jgi:hypothetical protein
MIYGLIKTGFARYPLAAQIRPANGTKFSYFFQLYYWQKALNN